MIKLRLVFKSELGEVMHDPVWEAALPPLPFTLLLPAGGCGRRAQREAVAAVAVNDAWETPLRGHYGAGSTFGGDREPEEGEAKELCGCRNFG